MMDERPEVASGAGAEAPLTVDEGLARLRERREQAQQQDPGLPQPEPEVEAVEDAGEAGEDAGGPADQGDQEEAGEARYRVKLDGQEQEVGLAELLAGYQRGADYTRKNQEVISQRGEVEAARAQVIEMQRTIASVLEQVRPQMEQQLGQEPDWEKLAEEDPLKWISERAKWEKVSKAREAQARLLEQQRVLQDQNMREHIAREAARLNERVPGWRDEAKRGQIQAEIRHYAQDTLGFSKDELAHAYDSRVIEAVHKAMLYDRMTKGRLPSMQPGQRPIMANGAKAPAAVRRANETFKNAPTVDNAVALLAAKRARNRTI
jgi:hypothetical protein